MPKMKTKSSAKKRFKITASGRIKSAQAGFAWFIKFTEE
jgi:large subunit ribosomal protein L35